MQRKPVQQIAFTRIRMNDSSSARFENLLPHGLIFLCDVYLAPSVRWNSIVTLPQGGTDDLMRSIPHDKR